MCLLPTTLHLPTSNSVSAPSTLRHQKSSLLLRKQTTPCTWQTAPKPMSPWWDEVSSHNSSLVRRWTSPTLPRCSQEALFQVVLLHLCYLSSLATPRRLLRFDSGLSRYIRRPKLHHSCPCSCTPRSSRVSATNRSPRFAMGDGFPTSKSRVFGNSCSSSRTLCWLKTTTPLDELFRPRRPFRLSRAHQLLLPPHCQPPVSTPMKAFDSLVKFLTLRVVQVCCHPLPPDTKQLFGQVELRKSTRPRNRARLKRRMAMSVTTVERCMPPVGESAPLMMMMVSLQSYSATLVDFGSSTRRSTDLESTGVK